MPSKSPTAQAIDKLIKEEIAPGLGAEGYKRSGRTFSKPSGELLHCVWIQASRWNSPIEASFTANLIVVWPRWHQVYTGKPISGSPALAASVVDERVNMLLLGKDEWWTVDHETNFAQLGSEVLRAIVTAAERFFAPYQDLGALNASLAAETSARPVDMLIRAVILADAGRYGEALALIESARNVSPTWKAVAEIADRLGLAGAA